MTFLSRFFSNDIGIDLGTANTLIYVKGEGIVLNEPTIVTRNIMTKKIIAVGTEAKEMVGRENSEIQTIRPLKDGVIADFEVTEEMIRLFIRKVQSNKFLIRPRIVVSVPSGSTEVERRAVRNSCERVGAREVYLVSEPMAAAIGMGLPVEQAVGSMVIDVGGGTTEIAVIALSGVVTADSIRIAGDEMDLSITEWMRKKYNLLIGPRNAEQLKFSIGSAMPLDPEKEAAVKGRDLVAAIPKTLMVDSREIREALSDPVDQIVAGVRRALEKTPPELAADILDRGMVLSGGGGKLRGLRERLIEATSLPTFLDTEDPLSAVVRGNAKVLDEFDRYQKVLF
ncbi:MAG: rod shape-determining protein [Gemmatimonadetes bacterium]|nr:rod shape-determining protein [Gemmatimonadota bacterium]MEC7843470.1 rod shape-determining protein [Candidatus Latescibacterota bacterium]